ncbi:hypothetical protein PTSG_11596 [Salpingoeca rosetta]|uniref:Sulfotransferase domain-containing protein n=1 Tax=Salpingoeca rosetta (strain ATCC 50818 / BSB-021) TaxID=946362 RepID=F2TWN3_SALR5|nr:uncharacterized protein PTSG_11596 [Salpingoeca rosetta]EGD72479.1 hypothetical protein PTSG_11596 [Salpingoeca rosetta]|eukprot:XP_004999048.1 hypothetical protein PTSG_11596 [Salpingoeca rosetta]
MPLERSLEQGSSEAVKRVKQRLSGFETEAGRRKGLGFQPNAGDVFIVTTPKAGTTWMQQICHQLRSRGSMDFEEISAVVPWIELAHDLGQDLEEPQVAQPRCFKTHCWYDHCPKGGKYIVVVRDPADVALSFYKFFEDWFFEPGEVGLEEFVREFWLARGVPESEMQNASYFHHLISWWQHVGRDDVLWVFFEDMKQDLRSVVQRVAAFMGIPDADDALIDKVVEHSSFEFMKAHEAQFDEHLSKLRRNAACGLPPDAGMRHGKINRGESGAAKKTLPAEVLADIHAKWKQVVAPVVGCDTYAAFRDKVHAQQQQQQQQQQA